MDWYMRRQRRIVRERWVAASARSAATRQGVMSKDPESGCNPRSSHQAGAVETHGTTGIVLMGRGRVRV
ncbi:hypothetical protein J4T94_gp043 [Mycobacterium phage Krypton555]|uniref:Uncharacterized protein n=1 Tax=Mycobacterium phage Krypton555 TaxID=2015885 RepID=A0A222ZT63_9CAUD|nr:hypothetical protein J4T94_gp043 [Mycobacterium phage Krypton555]ASR87170.1 hypothetical protein KRYPTON555_43 [Mycobacterium phage Krypton555]